MKRYNICDEDGCIVKDTEDAIVEENPNGLWVKYEDVKDIIDEAWWNARENEE